MSHSCEVAEPGSEDSQCCDPGMQEKPGALLSSPFPLSPPSRPLRGKHTISVSGEVGLASEYKVGPVAWATWLKS